jgi:aspartyl-tRNA synthetase
MRMGAPPHGGFGFGVDRFLALLAGERNIREVIAFPKSASGSEPMTGAPTPLPDAQLQELGIRVVEGNGILGPERSVRDGDTGTGSS